MTTFICLIAAILLSVLLAFVSYVQLLYLESLRLLRRETPALEHFREELAAAIRLDSERGSLSFSLIKHISLPLVGVFFLCALTRPEAPAWQSVLEAGGLSLASMFLMTYVVPQVLYRRTTGAWMRPFIPLVRAAGHHYRSCFDSCSACSTPCSITVRTATVNRRRPLILRSMLRR